MSTTKFITIAASLLVCVSISSCSNRVSQATAYDYKATETSTVAETKAPSTEYTWSTLSSGDCGYALLADNIISSSVRGKSATFPVIIEEAKECRGIYRLVNPMRAFGNDSDYDFNIIINASNPSRVIIERQDIGVDLGKGNVAIESAAARYLNAGVPAIVVEDAGLFGVCENGEITFSDNSFLIWSDGNREDSNAAGSFRIILPERVAAYEATRANIDYALGVEYINHADDTLLPSLNDPKSINHGAVAFN